VRELLPEVKAVKARLIYLADTPVTLSLQDEELDTAIAEASKYLAFAVDLLRSGRLASRRLSKDEAVYDEFCLALPADREAYLRRKRESFNEANRRLEPLWRQPV
jgi:hypothetical protein